MQVSARKSARLLLAKRGFLLSARRCLSSGDPAGDRALIPAAHVSEREVAVEPLEWQRKEDGKGGVYYWAQSDDGTTVTTALQSLEEEVEPVAWTGLRDKESEQVYWWDPVSDAVTATGDPRPGPFDQPSASASSSPWQAFTGDQSGANGAQGPGLGKMVVLGAVISTTFAAVGSLF